MISFAVCDLLSEGPCHRLQSTAVASASQPKAATRLAVFDSRIKQLSTLVEGVQPGVQSHILAPERDGIDQISAMLCKLPAVELTLIAPGFPGGLQVGATQLTLESLTRYEHQLRGWFVGIKEPKLSLLASNVSQGQQGRLFVSQLELATGASVKASAETIGQGHWLTATAKTFQSVVLNTYHETL